MSATIYYPFLLNDLVAVKVTGPDATEFLQSQLTQDVTALGSHRAALGAYCSARGRILASVIIVPRHDQPEPTWLLLTKADNAPAFMQRLRMFVLRAQVHIDVDAAPVIGISANALPKGCPDVPPLNGDDTLSPDTPVDATPFAVAQQGGLTWVAAPTSPVLAGDRWWVLGDNDATVASSEAAQQAWQACDIAAGLPWVQTATTDTFIAQTLNLDLNDGVSFSKGCYPGQEVVARSHYRGKIKRRMAYGTVSIATADAAAIQNDTLPGTDTFDAHRPDNACGRVVNAAAIGNTLYLLFEVQLADLSSADFRLGAASGPVITVQQLPYDIMGGAD